MTEKRVLIAALLSSVFLMWYAQMFSATQRRQPALPTASLPPGAEPRPTPAIKPYESLLQPIIDEEVVSLESSEIALEIGVKTGSIRSVTLKNHMSVDKDGPVVLTGQLPIVSPLLGKDPSLSIRSATANSVELSGATGGEVHTLSYTFGEHPMVLNMRLTSQGTGSGETEPQRAAIGVSWLRSGPVGRREPLELVAVRGDSQKPRYAKLTGPVKSGKNVPRGTFLLSLAEQYFCQSISSPYGPMEAKLLPGAEGTIPAILELPGEATAAGTVYSATIYMGPRGYFTMRQAGFAKAFKIGILGQIGIILVVVLEWISGVTRNYGVGIILLSALLNGLVAPFTLLGMRSMRKMQELKPKMDRIMAQHKDDPKKANVQVMALYKEHRVSPLGGCLPMLVQIPLFIALYQAINHLVGLRGASFLWMRDLSLPDRAFQLPLSLPFIGEWVNVLPLLMSVAMYWQTKLSQQSMPASDANPTAKMMSGPLMPLIFGLMLYHFPSGLVLYWMTNSLMSVALYRLAK